METQQRQNEVLAAGTTLPFPPDPTPQEEWIPLHEVRERTGYGERRITNAIKALGITVEPRLRQTPTGKRTIKSIPASTIPAITEYIEKEIKRINAERREKATAQFRTNGTFINPDAADVPATDSPATETNVVPAAGVSGVDAPLLHELRNQLVAKDALVK
jgi:hypothetical protein